MAILWVTILSLLMAREIAATHTVGCQTRAEMRARAGCRHATIDHGDRDEPFNRPVPHRPRQKRGG